jgi:hypothetical protein
MKMLRGERWFQARSDQFFLRDLPRVPVFVSSGKAAVKKGGPPTRGAKEPKPFIVGESLAGGEEVAL